ncbi:MAG: hypothetical protein GC180_09265 [Bacteroidetes bacterium]|nr:hypothetical protein [Bacteroidota bacterium]
MKLGQIIRTVVHLKFTQIYHQILLRIPGKRIRYSQAPATQIDRFNWWEKKERREFQELQFINLSIPIHFPVNWENQQFGLLWTYNLNYFSILAECKEEQGQKLMDDFVRQYPNLNIGKQPYPTSLRIINWIKFIEQFGINKREYIQVIWDDATRLRDNFEFHLLANHLLENACALYMAGLFFKESNWQDYAASILKEQLEEQFYQDGCHYERSPMYHLILTDRLLDVYIYCRHKQAGEPDLIQKLKDTLERAGAFMNWLTFMSDWPLFNDSAYGIAPEPDEIRSRFQACQLPISNLNQAMDSGFRRMDSGNMTLYTTCGNLTPEYQPGHAHADTLSFCLYVDESPVIVDPGTSTYQISSTRSEERSTRNHNTVTVNGANSSEIWSGFRVGRRAKCHIAQDTTNELIAWHDGYRKAGIVHERQFRANSNALRLVDLLKGSNPQGELNLLFHPSCQIEMTDEGALVNGRVNFKFLGQEKMEKVSRKYSPFFNKEQDTFGLRISFSKELVSEISIITN